MMANLHPETAANLHFAVCQTYRQAISEHRADREAFDLAARIVCQRHPGVPTNEARRRVAVMLCGDPPVLGKTEEVSFASSMELPK